MMFRRNLISVWLGILFLSGMFLMGQEGWNQPPPPEEVSVSILVQVDPLFPIEFDGLVGGDPVPDAEVTITMSRSGEVVASGFTNAEGEAVFELLEFEPYLVDVVADTSEPDCWWRERLWSSFYLTGPSDITVDVWRDGLGCVGPPREVSLLVQVHPLFPYDDFGLMPGDPVPNAEVEISNLYAPELIASGNTDNNGEILLVVPGIGRYYIFAVADTLDPYCWGSGGLDVVVGTEPLDPTLNVGVACE